MSDERIVLVARLKVRKDSVEEIKAISLKLVDDSRTEEGCVNYDLHQAIDDETVFIWHETWATKSALEEHFEKTYFKDFSAKVSECAEEAPLITLTKMISEKA